MDFSGRVSVITGGASGIGAATAALLRAEGARIVTWDRSSNADVQMDVSSGASVDAAMARTTTEFGVPTVLVAAAGMARTESLIDTSEENWDEIFAVNTKGVWLSYRAVAKEIRAAGLDGSIVGVSSVQAVLSDPYVGAYAVSKAAVQHLTRLAAVEWGMYGIRVNAVGPGATSTLSLQKYMDADPSYRQAIAENTPLGRVGSPELVAEGIVNVLRSDWMTGQVIMLDGGASLLSARGWSTAGSRMRGTIDPAVS